MPSYSVSGYNCYMCVTGRLIPRRLCTLFSEPNQHIQDFFYKSGYRKPSACILIVPAQPILVAWAAGSPTLAGAY